MPGEFLTSKPTRVTFTLNAMRERVRDLASVVDSAVPGNLVAVLMYGGIVANDFFPGASDANVVLVLRQAGGDTLRALAPTIQRAREYQRISTMVLTEEEIRTSADVFPVTFLDMRDRHILVFGQDPFAGLKISEEYLRLRCEQELKSLLFQLRALYVQHHASHVDLITHLLGSLPGFLVTLRSVLHLRHVEVGAGRRDVVFAAGTHLGLNTTCLHGLLDLKEGRVSPDPDDVVRTFGDFLDVLRVASAAVDALKISGTR